MLSSSTLVFSVHLRFIQVHFHVRYHGNILNIMLVLITVTVVLVVTQVTLYG